VAPYSSQRPVAVEAMTSSDSFLVCRTGGNGQALLVMSCDKQTLRWLAGAFDAIGKGTAFRLGDGRPVGSDDQCLVTVAPTPGRQRAVMARLAGHRFQWLLPVDKAHRFAGLIRAMAAFPGPCHHYLEADDPDLPAVLVSRGEYDADTLRRMRSTVA
jgi:hypothetical protein